MTPREIVAELNKHIIGQDDAKRAVAIALRNRWRRMQIKDANLRNEIMPKNILMIGPTGVGKTEIARRLAKLAGAPKSKVAGVELLTPLNTIVAVSQPLFKIHAQTQGELNYALDFITQQGHEIFQIEVSS